MNDISEYANPLSGTAIAEPRNPAPSGMLAVEGQRVMAEVQAQMLMARANPRNAIAAMDSILNACMRPTLAERAVYSYSRGGSEIAGPSIRLAEVIAQCWGNIKTSIRELDQRNGVSTVQTIAWDLETGYSSDKVFQVSHIRHTKKGAYRLEDPRDIYEMIANQGARRLRACILSVIPGDVTEAAVAQCEATLKAKTDTSPETVQKMLSAFGEYGVGKEHIEARIQRRLDAIQPAQVVSLKKVYASLRDGMSVAADWFEIAAPGANGEAATASSKTEAVKEKLKSKSRGAAKDSEPAPAHNPETGEIADFGPPDAMEAGRKARDEGAGLYSNPPEWEQLNRTALIDAYREGWRERDAELAEVKK
jgi:hypothetical protein